MLICPNCKYDAFQYMFLEALVVPKVQLMDDGSWLCDIGQFKDPKLQKKTTVRIYECLKCYKRYVYNVDSNTLTEYADTNRTLNLLSQPGQGYGVIKHG